MTNKQIKSNQNKVYIKNHIDQPKKENGGFQKPNKFIRTDLCPGKLGKLKCITLLKYIQKYNRIIERTK